MPLQKTARQRRKTQRRTMQRRRRIYPFKFQEATTENQVTNLHHHRHVNFENLRENHSENQWLNHQEMMLNLPFPIPIPEEAHCKIIVQTPSTQQFWIAHVNDDSNIVTNSTNGTNGTTETNNDSATNAYLKGTADTNTATTTNHNDLSNATKDMSLHLRMRWHVWWVEPVRNFSQNQLEKTSQQI